MQHEQIPETYQLEQFIATHDQVEDAKVVVVPDADHGELMIAWVIPNDELITEQSVKAFCDQSDEHTKPDHVLFTDEFPTTPSGKIQKIRLKEVAQEQLGLSFD
ncbi:fatty-acyl-CoA synthase [Alkalibacillus flavidus]|uniref:Fatty-acyl-CoA synthase n=1 Tax=Alkalibacillus flavidus TaxID=546021 RepID=A0ABV2KUK1_9BACI